MSSPVLARGGGRRAWAACVGGHSGAGPEAAQASTPVRTRIPFSGIFHDKGTSLRPAEARRCRPSCFHRHRRRKISSNLVAVVSREAVREKTMSKPRAPVSPARGDESPQGGAACRPKGKGNSDATSRPRLAVGHRSRSSPPHCAKAGPAGLHPRPEAGPGHGSISAAAGWRSNASLAYTQFPPRLRPLQRKTHPGG